MRNTEPEYGEEVEIPWGNRSTVRATVHEVYGHSKRHVVVILTPEMSDYVVSEPTTFSVPIDGAHRRSQTRHRTGLIPVWGYPYRTRRSATS